MLLLSALECLYVHIGGMVVLIWLLAGMAHVLSWASAFFLNSGNVDGSEFSRISYIHHPATINVAMMYVGN
jgi:hypothetical protein